MKYLNYLKWYFLIVTAFCIVVALTCDNAYLMPSAILAGVSYFGHILIVTGNFKHI